MQQAVRAQLASVLIGIVSQRLVRKSDGKGRVPAVEVLINNLRVKEMISDPARTAEISRVIEESNSFGMQSFDQSLMWLFEKKHITKEEALTHCTNVRDFQLRLSGIVGGGNWGNESEMMEEVDRKSQVKEVLQEEASHQSIEIEYGDVMTDPKLANNPPKKS
jgi:twitching motility protein PilT